MAVVHSSAWIKKLGGHGSFLQNMVYEFTTHCTILLLELWL